MKDASILVLYHAGGVSRQEPTQLLHEPLHIEVLCLEALCCKSLKNLGTKIRSAQYIQSVRSYKMLGPTFTACGEYRAM